jgi:hypothetical protein
MLVHHPIHGWEIPSDLAWLAPGIALAVDYQKSVLHREVAYCYVTVRHGEVTSSTDDVWHVDGFSMREPHLPEHDYLWCDHSPTECYTAGVRVPDDFDPMHHNLHWLFQDVIPEGAPVHTLPTRTLVVMDPYHIHRRPKMPMGAHRTLVRISMLPIPILTPDCAVNPAYPPTVLDREDIRLKLARYPI